MSARSRPATTRNPARPAPSAEHSTIALLAAKYDGRPLIPLEEIRTDYFPHLTMEMFSRKLSSGDIPLPVVRIEASQKSPRSVALRSLAAYLDDREREASDAVRRMAG